MRPIAIGIFGLSLWLACGPYATAQQWPQFRGLNAGTVSDDPSLPDTWSETENVVWKIDIPGLSWSFTCCLGRPHLRDDRRQCR